MKTKSLLLFALMLVCSPVARGAESLTDALQKGLFEEEANHNLEAALKAYQSVIAQTQEQRKVAATALFRLGECYRKLGQTNEAIAHYQRLLAEYSEQAVLVNLSRQNLAGLGANAPASAAPAVSRTARVEQARLLQEEILLLEKDAARTRELFQKKLVAETEVNAKERQVLGLRRQLAALESGEENETRQTLGATDEEDREVRRITALIKDSPDLINARVDPISNHTPLQQAARKGQLAVARFLLNNGADINLMSGGTTPLYEASAAGHKSMTELLLSKGANISTVNTSSGRMRRTALHVAAANGYRSVVEVLLAANADINARDEGGATPLFYAVQKPTRPIVELLLGRGADVNGKDLNETTPLQLAAAKGYKEIVLLLLTNKADVSVRDQVLTTPLHAAVQAGHADIVSLLIAHRAEIDAKTRGGETPLAAAVKQGLLPVALSLLEAGADPNVAGTDEAGGSSLLAQALNKNYVDMAAALLDHKADVEFVSRESSKKNWTPMHMAVSQRSPAMVTLLLKHNARLETPTEYSVNNSETGCTPLMMATVTAVPELVTLLLQAKANPNAAADSGNLPLHRAILHNSKPMVESLLQHGADVEARNAAGDTPLALAVRYADKDVVSLLLEGRADPNARSNDGLTPLHKAVGYDRRAAFDLLIATRADVNAGDTSGRTPLDYVREGVRLDRPTAPAMPAFGGRITTNPALGQRQNELSDILRKKGAVEWAPRLNYLTLTRRSKGASDAKFQRAGTNDFNRYTLFEAIAAHGWSAPPDGAGNPNWNYPDFSKVTITRREPATGKIVTMPVDVTARVNSGDCRQDMDLEWGDLIDLPESEHPLYDPWPGLTNGFVNAIAKCLTRSVKLTIKGQTKTLTLHAGTEPTGPTQHSIPEHAKFTRLPFRLRQTVLESGMVLTSSDLSRVNVRRLHPATREAQEWTFNLNLLGTPGHEMDLWLRHGDEINVPEKDPDQVSGLLLINPAVNLAAPPIAPPIASPIPAPSTIPGIPMPLPPRRAIPERPPRPQP